MDNAQSRELCLLCSTLSLQLRAVFVSDLLGRELKSACISAADFICCVKVKGANFHSFCFTDWLFQLHRGSSCVTRFDLALVALLWSVTAMCEDQLSQVQAQQFGPVDMETYMEICSVSSNNSSRGLCSLWVRKSGTDKITVASTFTTLLL